MTSNVTETLCRLYSVPAQPLCSSDNPKIYKEVRASQASVCLITLISTSYRVYLLSCLGTVAVPHRRPATASASCGNRAIQNTLSKTAEPGYNDIGLRDTPPVASDNLR